MCFVGRTSTNNMIRQSKAVRMPFMASSMRWILPSLWYSCLKPVGWLLVNNEGQIGVISVSISDIPKFQVCTASSGQR